MASRKPHMYLICETCTLVVLLDEILSVVNKLFSVDIVTESK